MFLLFVIDYDTIIVYITSVKSVKIITWHSENWNSLLIALILQNKRKTTLN